MAKSFNKCDHMCILCDYCDEREFWVPLLRNGNGERMKIMKDFITKMRDVQDYL